MEDEEPKSAVELAMARFKKQDADEGVRDRQLTDDQKREIAEVRKTSPPSWRRRRSSSSRRCRA